MTRFSRGGLAALAFITLAVQVHAADCDGHAFRSPQFDAAACLFHNPPHPVTPPAASPWANWTRFLVERKQGTVPVDPLPVRKVDAATLAALDDTGNHIIRLGHSSVLLKLRGKYWLVDPMFSDRASPLASVGPKRFQPPPLALADVPAIEGVLVSHDHYDHLDAPTLQALQQRVQRFFVPLGVGERLRGWGIAADRIVEMDWWQERQWGDVKLTATPAQHFSGRTLWDRNATLWTSWSVRSGDQHLYFSGDSGYAPHFRRIGARLPRIDVALLENGAYDRNWPGVHMQPEETVQAFQDLGARVLLPVHNSAFDLAFHPWSEPLRRIAALAQQKGIVLATPELGEVVTVGRPRENRRWWEGVR